MQTTIPTDCKELKQFKARVHSHTDHGYFGIESGFTLSFGPTNLNKGKYEYIEIGCIKFGEQLCQDFNLNANPQIFADYALKKRHFEGVFGSMTDRTKF